MAKQEKSTKGTVSKKQAAKHARRVAWQTVHYDDKVQGTHESRNCAPLSLYRRWLDWRMGVPGSKPITTQPKAEWIDKLAASMGSKLDDEGNVV